MLKYALHIYLDFKHKHNNLEMIWQTNKQENANIKTEFQLEEKKKKHVDPKAKRTLTLGISRIRSSRAVALL